MVRLKIACALLFFNIPLFQLNVFANETDGYSSVKLVDSSQPGFVDDWNVTNSTSSVNELAEIGGLTFFKDFGKNQHRSFLAFADFSIGRNDSSHTASRGTSNPATYIGENGVITLLTNSGVTRYTQGHYDYTGFISYPGLIIEGATTNYHVRTDGTATSATTGGTTWTGWISEFTASTPTYSVVDIPDLTNITNAKSARIQWSGTGTNNNVKIVSAVTSTAEGSFVSNDVVTVSCWMRSQTGFTGTVPIRMEIYERDVANVAQATSLGGDFFSLITTDWKRFERTYTLIDPDTTHISIKLGSQAGVDTGDVIDVEFYGLNVEKLPYATTWVPTSTAALTRNAESLTYEIADNRTAATETMFFEFMSFWGATEPATDNYLTDTDTKKRYISHDSATNLFTILPNATDSPLASVSATTSITSDVSYVLTGAMQSTGNPNTEVYMNGVSEATDLDDFTANAWGDTFYVGTSSGGNTFYGILQSAVFYNRVLTSGEVEDVYEILT